MSRGGVLGTGIDLVENDRMRGVLNRWGAAFKDRVFLKTEQEYCDSRVFPHHHYAGRFAVKEAVSKALGTGFGPHIAWRDIEVARDAATGAPFVRLSRRAKVLSCRRGVHHVLVSLSHTRNYAVAQALLVGDSEAAGEETGLRTDEGES